MKWSGAYSFTSSFCYCFVSRGFSLMLHVPSTIDLIFARCKVTDWVLLLRFCDHICPSCAPLQFWHRGIGDSQSQMQSSSETYIMHVTNTNTNRIYIVRPTNCPGALTSVKMRDGIRCRWVFKRFLNLYVSEVSLMLSGKDFQAAGQSWLEHHSPNLVPSATYDVVSNVGRPQTGSTTGFSD